MYSVSNPGSLVDHNLNGYICIGTGGPHAMYYLIGSGNKNSMTETNVKKILEEAKGKAEVAPGVGSLSECRIIF